MLPSSAGCESLHDTRACTSRADSHVCQNDRRLPAWAHVALAIFWFRVVTAGGLLCRVGMQGFAWACASRFAMKFTSPSRPADRQRSGTLWPILSESSWA